MGRQQKKESQVQWGHIEAVKDRKGRVVAWCASYDDPASPSEKIERFFGHDEQARAMLWLEQERQMVSMASRGILAWKSPEERDREADEANPTLAEFVNREFIPCYRKRDGSRPRGGTRRNMIAACSHFLGALGDLKVSEITPRDIQIWYDSEHPEGAHAFYGSCQTLKQALGQASRPFMGRPALRNDNPFTLPMPLPPDSPRRDTPPITPEQFERLVNAMPAYVRIAPYLSLMVGGLRSGELCALQVKDIDLDARILTVRHSVNRGPDDLGSCQLGDTKTKSSRRTCPIPSPLVGVIRDHIDTYCDAEKGGEAMILRPKQTDVMSPTTLQGHFRAARKAAGREDITFHTLRASHATLFVLKGGTVREVMDELGHASTQVAIRHYQRIVPEHRTQTANLLAFDFMPTTTDPACLHQEIDHLDKKIRDMTETRDRLVAILDGLEHNS